MNQAKPFFLFKIRLGTYFWEIFFRAKSLKAALEKASEMSLGIL